jgi:hypothetical protein
LRVHKSKPISFRGKKGGKVVTPKPVLPLEEHFPNVFTWVANPKECSFAYIKKYLQKHYKDLDTEGKWLKNAIEGGVSRGQLKRVTGQGMSGTFALVDGAKKCGNKYEDAIEDAVIASNDPKDATIMGLRDYLGEYLKEYNTDMKPKVLMSALERSEARGHIVRLSGKGFTGKFKLNHPYYPSPKELWGKWCVDLEKSWKTFHNSTLNYNCTF